MRILDRHTHDPYHNQNQVWQEDTPDIAHIFQCNNSIKQTIHKLKKKKNQKTYGFYVFVVSISYAAHFLALNTLFNKIAISFAYAIALDGLVGVHMLL